MDTSIAVSVGTKSTSRSALRKGHIESIKHICGYLVNLGQLV